jgi:regulatory protein
MRSPEVESRTRNKPRNSGSNASTDDPEAAREAALKLLEGTRRTRSDLARRLRDKGYASPTVEAVLARLEAVGLVDDVEFARAFLAARWGRRAAGIRRIELELRAKGVSPEALAAARARFESEHGAADEVTAARRVLAQMSNRYAKLDPRVRRQRQWALLSRRGFGGDVIAQALNVPDDTSP